MNSDRYIRQTSLKEFGYHSQKKLSNSKVLVVGAGGLGIPVLQYLTAMGVRTIGIVENDVVELTNLQRQVIYSENDIGRPKIYAVINQLKNINREVEFLPFKTFLTPNNALDIIGKFDVIVDATDNFPTRYLINDSCIILDKPFVYGALHSFEGQISVFNYNNGPSYRCLFPKMPSENEIPDCNENGVLGVIPGIIGTLQALEVVKIITGIGDVLSGTLLMYDGLIQEFNKMYFQVNKENKQISSLQDNYGFIGCNSDVNIEIEDFIEIWNTQSDIKVLDVRESSELLTGHLDNIIHIPLLELLKNPREIDTYQLVYILCQSGQRSEKAANFLQNRFPEKRFLSVKGGYNSLDSKIALEK